MKQKSILSLSLILSICILCASCGGSRAVSSPSSAQSTAVSSASFAAESSSAPETTAAVKGIVFKQTIDDPQAATMNAKGSTDVIDLTLIQTAPNVYEGHGTITRNISIPDKSCILNQQYIYRTGLLRAEPGKEQKLTLTCELLEDKDMQTLMGTDAPIRMVNHKEGSAQLKDTPVLLQLMGEKATLTVKLHDKATLVFEGSVTNTVPPSADTAAPAGTLYINSLWSDAVSGGSGDYTAILLASQKTDKSYFGKLTVMGSGDTLKAADETVTFTLNAFDAAAYKEAGGKLSDTFTQMGVIKAGGENYIVLLDGQQALLEPAGQGVVFFGRLCSDAPAALQNEADKTMRIFSCISRQKVGTAEDYSAFKGLDPKNPEDMEKIMALAEKLKGNVDADRAVPAWYPEGLIPTVNFSADDGYLTTPTAGTQFFKLYTTEYAELEDFDELIPPYRKALSGYDNFKEHINSDALEGAFVFTMGRYTLQVHLVQVVKGLTNVTVQIY
ncbi:hypothetical protein [Acetanaerobacterium elongatum]|uniref:Lipoprotein n=1 Tax=Acetanaerobacterium elongatum TaxID=258515 RepID=A0A1G9XAQ7_9FIRM|nr:hypothetical protein [Acetanaerobacterium elongatum]SDM93423.1 hypothetical protein SAMN05192585_1086 [Acetanaerobacterium elongatum]